MRMWTRCLMLMLAITVFGCLAYAQQAAQMQGTVYLRGGQVITGNIQSAELGFRDGTGTGVGTELPGNGAIAIKMPDGAVLNVPAADIAVIEAKWQHVPQARSNPWQVMELKVTKRDGTVVAGAPDWFMHASSVAVETQPGQVKRIHAFPLATDFAPDDLLVKIELGAVAPAPTPITPVTETPVTTPSTPTAPTPVVTITPVEPVTETPSVAVTPQPTTPATEIGEVHVLPSQDVVITLHCPNCGQAITLLIRVSALQGVATGASGVSVSPVVPAPQ